jgi:hypothetical protein
MTLLVAAGVCAAASAQAATKCKFHDKETVIVDNDYPRGASAWAGVPYPDPDPTGGIQGQNDPWSIVGFVAQRVGWETLDDYSFGDSKWTIGATGDFDGDGDCDLAWWQAFEPEGQGKKIKVAVTFTPDDPLTQRFQEPIDEGTAPTPFVELAGHWEIVGSGHFLNAAGTAVEPAGQGAKADLVLWSGAPDGGLVVWTDAANLQGARTVANGIGGGTRAVAVANFVGPSALPEVIWRNGDLTPLYYTTITFSSGSLSAGPLQSMLSPGDFNWRVRGAGYFNDDDWEDLLLQNLPNSERTVIWMMDNGVRTVGGFTNPDLLVFEVQRGVIENMPRVIVSPR